MRRSLAGVPDAKELSSAQARPWKQKGKCIVSQVLHGLGHSSGRQLKQAPVAPFIRSIQHLKTVRGHHSPVYCLAVDKTGLLAVTGADDSFVKVCPFQLSI